MKSEIKKQKKEFNRTVMSIKSEKEMNDFLEAILTPAEFEEIPVRLQIFKMLKSGVPQREIAEKLGVGIATVTRGSRELKSGKLAWWNP